ncbi:MAG: type II secretion system F family protein [Planctomycetales bacterium]|jgi:type IV pilus assembly protein PilC|nr:type II secretion system F family protein [Planctomycetales bacterium]MBN8624664.1 type II secretion system F family protein [Planctomycetota bacterium]
MPTFQFEAMDPAGKEIKDVIEAANEEEAQATIRGMGYYVTKISAKKARRGGEKKAAAGGGKGKAFVIGGVKSKELTMFTRQLSILQDAGLPILRSLKILEQQSKPGRLKNTLMDICEDIESGSTLSESMSKCPKVFDRLYVNMIKAGEAGGALEVILRRLAEFQEKSQSLKRKVKGAMVYPIVVVMVAVGILTFIMIKIVPAFEKIFKDFDAELPAMTQMLINISNWTSSYWFLIPVIPISIMLMVKLICKFKAGRMGWDLFMLKLPVFGQIVEKNIVARTTRTLGTLVASGVPILEALNITRETSGNAVFEQLYGRIYDSIREGESIAKPMREYSRTKFNLIALFFWTFFIPGVGALIYLTRATQRIIDDLVVNMIDVGEETGELDKMLYKVADNYDEEVDVLTESLVSLLEPLLIVVLGVIVGFIVIALFLPLVALIQKLS